MLARLPYGAMTDRRFGRDLFKASAVGVMVAIVLALVLAAVIAFLVYWLGVYLVHTFS
jgi:Mg/Co/Ni transporter MgtE